MNLSNAFSYENPHPGAEPGVIRDPFITKLGELYYMTATLPPFWAGPCPGVPLWSSSDLIKWKHEGLLIDRARIAPETWHRDRFWAPEIHAADGWFYLTFNCRNEETRHRHGIVIARAQKITGPYEILTPDAPFPPCEETHYYEEGCHVHKKYISNDASLATGADGRHFIYWSHKEGIWQAEIELPSCRLIGGSSLAIASSEDGWDTKIEGPVVLHRGDYYYLFFSSFTRTYEIGVARSRSLGGPWVQQPSNPFLVPRAPYTHCGHNGVFPGPDGNIWISYLIQCGAESPERMAYDPIRFTADGWIETDGPTFGRRTITW